MGILDFILGPIYLLIIFAIVSYFKNYFTSNKLEETFYIRAFWFKIFGVTFFAFIYHYYYKGGDTLVYYDCCQRVHRMLFNDFSSAWTFLTTNDFQAYLKFRYYEQGNCNWFAKYGTREITFIKIASIINLIALNTYLSTSYIFAFISFIASWKLYQVFVYQFPLISNQLLFAALFMPTVAFWGTGIMKDTVSYTGLCFIIYYINDIFIERKYNPLNFLYLIISAIFISLTKGYILLAFLPAGVMWIFFTYQIKIKSQLLRYLAGPFMVALTVISIFLLINVIGDSLDKFSLDKLEQTAEDFQRWHTVASIDGSGYTLNFGGFNLTSMLKVLPQAVNVTYFRPYLWEAGSVVVLLGAFESLFFFLFFLKTFIIDTKITGFLKVLTSHPIILMCLVFTILFGLVVGVTSYNFGALSRYKIPAMPLFALMLVVISYQANKHKYISKPQL